MSLSTKFQTATAGLKTGAKYLLIANIIIPIGGLLAHVGGGVACALDNDGPDGNGGPSYSLKNRFETAYSFNTPESHKTYYGITETYGHHDWDYYAGQTPYLASPYATYGAMLLAGGLGFVIGARRKEKELIDKQHTR